jgi:hypothetical protein
MKKESKFLLALGIIFFLSLSFVYSESGQVSVNFFTGGMQCQKTATSANWFNSSSLQTIPVTSSGNCSRYSLGLNLPSCCPTGQACNFNTGVCYYANIVRCDQYTLSSACNADDQKVGNNSVPNPSLCGVGPIYNYTSPAGVKYRCVNQTSCSCSWANGNCSALQNFTRQCYEVGIGDIISYNEGHCTWGVSNIQNNCNTSLRNIVVRSFATWTSGSIANPAGQGNCTDVSRTYPCVYTARLDFSTNLGVVILVILIILVYLYLSKKIKIKQLAKKNK